MARPDRMCLKAAAMRVSTGAFGSSKQKKGYKGQEHGGVDKVVVRDIGKVTGRPSRKVRAVECIGVQPNERSPALHATTVLANTAREWKLRS